MVIIRATARLRISMYPEKVNLCSIWDRSVGTEEVRSVGLPYQQQNATLFAASTIMECRKCR